MRRTLRMMTAAVLLAGVAACAGSAPEGIDGDLTDGWAVLPAAVPFRPVVGECHESLVEVAAMPGHRPVNCAELHVAETAPDIRYADQITDRGLERRVRCFPWFRGGKLTRSLAGAGPSALPVR